MKLKIMDYEYREYYAKDVPLEDVESVTVRVISGDELLRVKFENGDERFWDVTQINNKDRIIDFYDGEYEVLNKDLVEWNNRRDTYDWLWR